MPIMTKFNKHDTNLVIKRLEGILESLKTDEAVLYEHSYSTVLNEGKIKFVFGLQAVECVK